MHPRIRARFLRRSMTDAEHRLWFHVRDRRLAGCKFRRQHPIGPYFADFACVDRRLVVELDGGQHAEARDDDRRRTTYLEREGWRVIRFWNDEVLTQTEVVLEAILMALNEPRSPSLPAARSYPHPDPLPQAGEGTGSSH